MSKKYETPTLEQMTKIAAILSPELEDLKKENITILFNLNKENLTRLDEELFFRMNPDAKMEDFEPNYEEINVTIGDINFKFMEHAKSQE
jgi:hypothetical protein